MRQDEKDGEIHRRMRQDVVDDVMIGSSLMMLLKGQK